MNPWTLTTVFLLAIKSWLDAHPASAPYDGPLSTLWMGLYTAPTPPVTPTSDISSIVEADYNGYARQEITWYPPFVTAANAVKDKGIMLQFRPTDSLNPQTITGVFLASLATGGILQAGSPITPVGVPLPGPGAALFVTPEFELPSGNVYGGPILNF